MPAVTRATASTQQKSDLPPEAYRQAVNQADLAISITDTQAVILFANEAFSRVTGYSADEIVGQNESILSNQTSPDGLYKGLWEELAEQRPWSCMLLNRKKDGQLYLAELTISPVVDAQGKTTHFVGMHRDVTELHRLECLVRNQKKLIESVIDTAPIAFVVLDQNGKVILDNHEYKKLLSDLHVAEPAHTLLDSLSPNWREMLISEPETCAFDSREARIDRPLGRARWLSVTTSLIEMHSDCADSYFNTGSQPGLLLVISDISILREEQARARSAVMQAVLADEERTAAIREGLSAAIFRLQEPMNVMASAAAILQRRDPASAEALQQALAASREHLESLRQVIPPNPQEIEVRVNLNEVLRDVLQISTQRLLGAGIVVDWRPALTLPPIIGRPLQLCLLFKALVDNAIEAMNIKGWHRRELSISSAVERECIVITVSDSGPGIPPDSRHKAFEPFFSAKPASGPHIGTGLSRAQQVVADHGGIIDLEESSSGGCLVIVEFRLDGDPI
ncbi:MAG: nitrogen fixation negative regulator NifL [Propionivibrio sp.]|uniref:histidine kinase n=1 Tax=Candidatus Propionivibrio dominans TaxID=2954373 RepID=A0A9D7F7X6_9RHOO|nr:nitrogen fixation negative regulator NifL [Candidatus Propionivibrio dominans]